MPCFIFYVLQEIRKIVRKRKALRRTGSVTWILAPELLFWDSTKYCTTPLRCKWKENYDYRPKAPSFQRTSQHFIYLQREFSKTYCWQNRLCVRYTKLLKSHYQNHANFSRVEATLFVKLRLNFYFRPKSNVHLYSSNWKRHTHQRVFVDPFPKDNNQ